MRITLRTLGGLAILRDGETLPSLPAHRLRCALLIYLSAERQASRDGLITLLWPERDPERARHSLSQLLYELRQELGAGCLESRGDVIVATPALGSDAAELEEAVEAGALEDARRLYRGAFLESVSLHESAGFRAWVAARRAHLAGLHRQVRRTLMERRLAARDLEGALAVAREWSALEPLDDEAQHRTLELLCAVGEGAEALSRYEAYRQSLEARALEPLEATRALIDRLRADDAPSDHGAPIATPLGHPTAPRPASPAAYAGSGRPADPPDRSSRSWAGALAVLVLALATTVWVAGGAGSRPGAAAHADPARVAILPFEDHSPSPGLGSLTAAFTEQLTRQLGSVEGLSVVPPSAVRRFRDSDAPLDSIARALGAGTLITGSFVGTDSAVEMRLELVDPRTTRSLVPFRVRRSMPDPLDLLDELAGEAANFIRVHMGERLELERRRQQATSPEAWALVLAADEARAEARGLAAYGDSAAGEAAHRALLRADSLLALASRQDAGWREPWLLRGWIAAEGARLVELTTHPVDGDLYAARARAGLPHAGVLLERDSADAAALELRGTLRYRMARRRSGGEWERLLRQAEDDLTRAVAIDPARARAWQALSEIYQVRGQHAEARLAAEKALRADAYLEQADEVLHRLFDSALYLEDYAGARESCHEGQQRFPQSPDFLACELVLRAFTEALPAELDTAWQLVWRERTLRPARVLPERVPRQKLEMAGIAARAGLADSARALIRQGRLDAAGLVDVQIRLNYYEARVRLRLGEHAAARDLLRKLVAAVPSAGEALARDPWLAPILADGAGIPPPEQ